MPHHEVVKKTVPPLWVASRRITIPTNDQVPEYLNPTFEEVFKFIGEQGAKPGSPHLALWHTSAETLADEDAEAAVPIDRPLTGSETVKVYELPQVEVASAVHHGDFSEFTQLHTALLGWIEANGYRVSGPFRELYLEHDPDDPKCWQLFREGDSGLSAVFLNDGGTTILYEIVEDPGSLVCGGAGV